MKVGVVDVGNTSTAVGLWTDGKVSGVRRFAGKERRAAFGAVAAMKGIEKIAYLSVVPKEDAGWRRFAKGEGLRLKEIGWRDFPLELDYAKKETIGADRLADAAAAVKIYGAPVIVCDFGTAFTAAAITADKVWRGGIIAPGLPMMLDYLHERTAKLPRIKADGRVPKIGRSTEEAMKIGAIVGARGMVREIVAELKGNFGEDFRLVATGGYARRVLKGIGMDFTIDSELTLKGAGMMA